MRFLDSVINVWDSFNVGAVRSTVKRADDDSKLVIEIEGAGHVATIEAWEHASCLDITVLELASKASTILSAGECRSLDDMKERFAQLLLVIAS